jgi:hypothetical protein
MNEHYKAVLADLKQMKQDAEAGITAIERLIARASEASPVSSEETDLFDDLDAPGVVITESVPQRVIRFLATRPGHPFTVDEIVKGATVGSVPTLRGALGRMVKAGKISKQGRGRYRTPRTKAQNDSASAA